MSNFKKNAHDLCCRTMVNLKYIELANKQDSENKVFEITQLINSLLGIIVNIRENYIESAKFSEIQLTQGIKDTWGIPKTDDKNMADFLKHLRHAIAHLNFEYDDKGTGNIKRIKMRNFDTDTRNETWYCSFSVGNIRKFLIALNDYVQEH